MNYFLSAAVVVLGVIVVLLVGAQIEMFKNLEFLREYSGYVDKPLDLEIANLGQPASSVGLPASLDQSSFAGVLFLSNRCSTCRAIALDLTRMPFPKNLFLVIDRPDGVTGGLAYDFEDGRVAVDDGHKIFNQLSLTSTPSLVTIKDGNLSDAMTMPSTRRLMEQLVPDVAS